ncbi:FAD-dependent monooxygenase [Pseudofrankia inefficax]|uniref:Monooxygenase FAD-binding protein n=1 Tax=Pseudofrankia inefficax (strain DSM 45817 / CECT 9037 / DDB 130130 / EuI1c) TaxID=298654 RepID=E3JBU3_PSEI1|nr:FAD-dependent monooxygenase [Pseudofrankia inefficax]ADP82253.1 monooxygenase FAD-binding protein [Pseudofrankia inefficax]
MAGKVVVVGAGPVGLMVSCELALAGVETVTLDRLPRPREESMGMAINGTVVDLLEQRGLLAEVFDQGLEWPAAHFAHLALDPTRLASPHRNNMLMPQTVVEARLARRAVDLGVEVRRGEELVAVDQDERAVRLELRSAAGPSSLEADYVVGCDGADSTVRRLAGIGFPGVEYPFHGIVAELEFGMDEDSELWHYFGTREYPAGVFALAPTGEAGLRLVTAEFGVDPVDRDAPVSVPELRASVEALTGRPLDIGTPRWMRRWFNATRQADRYRAGRIFLAGDAAHVHFPLGGQALSTGVEDAVNLGWKLASVLAGTGPEDLLDSYHDERHPVGARACSTTLAQVALLHPLTVVAPLRELLTELFAFDEVNQYLVRMVGGQDVRYPMPDAGDHPLAGRRLADLPETTPVDGGDVTRLLQDGRAFVLGFAAAGPAGELAAWSDRVSFVAVEPLPGVSAEAVLVRPDGRIAWAGPAADGGLTGALRRWFGPPSDRPAALETDAAAAARS